MSNAARLVSNLVAAAALVAIAPVAAAARAAVQVTGGSPMGVNPGLNLSDDVALAAIRNAFGSPAQALPVSDGQAVIAILADAPSAYLRDLQALCNDGFRSEVAGFCTHPEHYTADHAADLSAEFARRNLEAGQTFLNTVARIHARQNAPQATQQPASEPTAGTRYSGIPNRSGVWQVIGRNDNGYRLQQVNKAGSLIRGKTFTAPIADFATFTVAEQPQQAEAA
jgi:hypothetical protein